MGVGSYPQAWIGGCGDCLGSRSMTRRIHRTTLRIPAVIAVAAFLAVATGCAAPPISREARSTDPSRTSGTSPTSDAGIGSVSEDVTFAAGAALTADSDIRWGDGLIEDEGWAALPSDQPGRWSYRNASGSCTAAFRGGVLGDAGGMDDREATDALIEHQSGGDFLGQGWLTDGEFLRYGGEGSGVEHRQFSYTFNEVGYFMAARAFVEADYSVWVTVTCEGEPVGPVVQEMLSKNFIAVDE